MPIQLLSGVVGSTVRLPYVPNSMVMDQTGSNLYFGSSHELMVFTTAANALSKQDTSVPGKVLAVSPNNQTLLINDPIRQVFYIYGATSGSVTATFGGVGTSAIWTPDSKTLYITDTAAAGAGHSNTVYVYNANTGWTTCSAGQACAQDYAGAANLALTIPGVGAYSTGATTEARTWCPSGTVGNYNSMVFYPQGDALVGTETDALAATTDGAHIIGAALAGGGITLSDIGVTIPTTTGANGIPTPAQCSATSTGVLSPLIITHTLAQTPVNVNATNVNQVVTSPTAVVQGTAVSPFSLSFITYNGTTGGATLPYYRQVSGPTSALGTVGYVTLNGASAVTAPIAGAFSPDDSQFFVSTSGDNKIHYIDTTTLTDTQQISPNLPACAPGSDPDCTLTTPQTAPVPATVIVVKPRSTT